MVCFRSLEKSTFSCCRSCGCVQGNKLNNVFVKDEKCSRFIKLLGKNLPEYHRQSIKYSLAIPNTLSLFFYIQCFEYILF